MFKLPSVRFMQVESAGWGPQCGVSARGENAVLSLQYLAFRFVL